MEPDVRQSCLLQQHLHPVVGSAGAHRLLRSQRFREDPLTDCVLLPLFQPLDSAGGQADSASASLCLGLADLHFTPLRYIHRAEDFQRPSVLIKVPPHEAADLTSTQASCQLRVEEVPPDFVLVHCRKERIHLLPVENLLRFVVVLGQLDTVRWVIGNDVIPFRILEAAVEHGVDAEHHAVR